MHVSEESDDPVVPTKRANKDWLIGSGGVRGGKGIDQGKRLTVGLAPDTEPDTAGRITKRRDHRRWRRFRSTRGRSRMR